jgi:hypothetical protein
MITLRKMINVDFLEILQSLLTIAEYSLNLTIEILFLIEIFN